MRIVSITISNSKQDVIGPAIQSVAPWVDTCLILDTGITDSTIEVARSIAGDKLRVCPCESLSKIGCGDARNLGLKLAYELGGDWAVMCDSDERLHVDPVAIQVILNFAQEQLLLLRHGSGVYTKERFFRLPIQGQYVGPAHETYLGSQQSCAIVENGFFEELDKTPEQNREKAEWVVSVLRPHAAANLRDPRWHYYIGDSLQFLGRYDEAVHAFKTCALLRGRDEEGAWACFRAGQCCLAQGKYQDTVDVCALGMSRHPAIAELPWLAGWAAFKLGNFQHAIYWAHLAVAWGCHEGGGKFVRRIGYKALDALYESPYDILRWAHKALGQDEAAERFNSLFDEALLHRQIDQHALILSAAQSVQAQGARVEMIADPSRPSEVVCDACSAFAPAAGPIGPDAPSTLESEAPIQVFGPVSEVSQPEPLAPSTSA